jgi:BirA family biotin operon repressor/biotin-[acetyl-CoA-carboxylase] ligase
MNIIRVQTADSTNRLLKTWVKRYPPSALEEGTMVMADVQTAGRGRGNTSWEAEPGKNITCSLLLYPTFLSLKQPFLLSEVVALGVKETLDSVAGRFQPFTVKWPNDIYYEDRKIAGILIENELMDRQITRSIVGIGINVNQEVFTSDAPNPISLRQLIGVPIPLDGLLETMYRQIMQWYQKLKDGQFESITMAYHSALYRKTGFHSYEDKSGQFNAQIQSVSADGFLHLVTDMGDVRRYAFKEVSFVMELGG